MKTKVLTSLTIAILGLGVSQTSFADDKYIGEIFTFAGNFCPSGSKEAKGQSLPVNQYNALFSLLGTTYGGDGKTNFNLPDLV
jgi:microcystin-dependent protein